MFLACVLLVLICFFRIDAGTFLDMSFDKVVLTNLRLKKATRDAYRNMANMDLGQFTRQHGLVTRSSEAGCNRQTRELVRTLMAAAEGTADDEVGCTIMV
jgi:hypothetical protein